MVSTIIFLLAVFIAATVTGALIMAFVELNRIDEISDRTEGQTIVET